MSTVNPVKYTYVLTHHKGRDGRSKNTSAHEEWSTSTRMDSLVNYPNTSDVFSLPAGAVAPGPPRPVVGVGHVTADNLRTSEDEWIKSIGKWHREMVSLFGFIWGSLDKAAKDLAAAEEQWLALEMRREELEGQRLVRLIPVRAEPRHGL